MYIWDLNKTEKNVFFIFYIKIYLDGMGHSTINIDKDRKTRSGICDESSGSRGYKNQPRVENELRI